MAKSWIGIKSEDRESTLPHPSCPSFYSRKSVVFNTWCPINSFEKRRWLYGLTFITLLLFIYFFPYHSFFIIISFTGISWPEVIENPKCSKARRVTESREDSYSNWIRSVFFFFLFTYFESLPQRESILDTCRIFLLKERNELGIVVLSEKASPRKDIGFLMQAVKYNITKYCLYIKVLLFFVNSAFLKVIIRAIFSI